MNDSKNVHGLERIGSLASGVMMVGKGLRRGGIFGLIQVAIGGVALARGFTGHSSLKDKLEQGRQEMNTVRTKNNGMRTASFLRFSICAKNEQVYT